MAVRFPRWGVGALLLLCAGSLMGVWVTRLMDLPPAVGPGLTGVVRAVEQKGLGTILSVEYERDWWRYTGLWEVKSCKERCLKIYIDPRSGEEVRREAEELEDELPPPNAQGAFAIAKSFEDRKVGIILEMEFEHGAWKVKYREERGLAGALQPTIRRMYQPLEARPTEKPAPTPGAGPRSWGPPPRLPAFPRSRTEIRI